MKIQRLTVAGFGPYKDEQRIDFERFDDDGIFLITGKTGAGKSSLLDAICFALYGSAPRYDGAQPKLRSDYCELGDPTWVELEFRISGTSYRVRRAPEYERPKKSGSGTTVEKATAELFVKNNDLWEGVAARPVDVARELEVILGLTKDQFLQVILLAQNRFQEFLLAKNDERQAVLRTLFGTKRFEQVELALTDRRKQLASALESTAGGLRMSAELAAGLVQQETPVEPELAWFDAILAQLGEAQAAAARAATIADAEFTAADAEHRRLENTRRLQLRRDSARDTLATFEAQSGSIDADRTRLDQAQRAASVWAHVAAVRGATAALDRAVAVEAERRAAYAAAMDGIVETNTMNVQTNPDENTAATEIDAKAVSRVLDDLARRLGALDPVLDDEKSLPQLSAAVRRCEERHESCRAAIEDANALVASLPAQLDELTESLAAARVAAAGIVPARERVARIDVARAAAKRAVTLDRRLIEARFAEKDASARLTESTRAQDDLFARRLSGYAAELAGELTEGTPCAVCGSVEHPHVATTENEPVTEADIEAARSAVTTRRAELDAATATAHGLVTQLAEAHAAAGNKSIDELEIELLDAAAALLEAEAALTVVDDGEKAQARLRSSLDSASEHLDRLRTDGAAAADQLSTARNAFATVTARVEAARASFASVHDRATSMQTALEAVKDFAAAIDELAVRSAALDTSREVLEKQLSENDFTDESQVEKARRSSAEIAALDTRIREHDQSVGTARATLREPELIGLPVDPVDLVPSATLLAQARAARDEALQAPGLLADRFTQLEAIVRRVHAEQEASARLREEYDQVRALASAVQGSEPNTKRMRLETYVLAGQLEEIVTAANARLRTMTSGRYTLQHDDSVQYRNVRSGLGLAILDEHTGRARATHSLSGGETFLASLALALGLAEVVTNQAGGISLDTLFIDEGFGSLDRETLEIAMSTLDSLRSGGRTIGLISHVEAMKEQIPAKLRITVTDAGDSRVETTLELV
ncbi:AAA family ATPase [Mycetocola miduiensis]|uniref:Nuclease SbcCD subunit C n=1 Tax=Mycetocola miduiensis TaxID=995034 RepID=A0A1I5C9X5_9MICO|nr:SMC family ATPase [Mycetocola miduiensis]SFN83820.1 exonuclease SbcC [Mycetocola miduiensis]